MGFAAAGVLCGCFGVAMVVLVAGALLRLAIHVANRTVRPTSADLAKPARRGGIAEWDWDDWDEGEASDGADEPDRPWRARPAIPDPGTLKSTAVALGAGCVFVIGLILTRVVLWEMGFRMWSPDTRLAAIVLNLPLTALALTLLLSWTLPTRFWRAALVTFAFGLVVLAFMMFWGLAALFVTRIR